MTNTVDDITHDNISIVYLSQRTLIQAEHFRLPCIFLKPVCCRYWEAESRVLNKIGTTALTLVEVQDFQL